MQHTTAMSRVLGRAVEVISPAPRDLWRSALSVDFDALRSHTPEWTDIICAVDGWTNASRLYLWPSGRGLVLPMVAKRICGLTLVEESLPLGWGYGGLVGGDVTPEEAATVYADLVGSYPLFRRCICPNSLQGGAWNAAIAEEARSATILPRRSHSIDLNGGAGAVWKRFSENARRCVRKAEKQGLEVECDTTGELLGVFHELWLMSTERWARQLRHPLWLVRSHGRRQNPETRWKQIAQREVGAVANWVARYRGQSVAAIVVLRGPNDHYMRGVMDKDLAGPTRANFLLHWLAIQDACQRGARWYQMGRSDSGGGELSRFKENFGARTYEFPEIRLERLPITRLDQAARAAAKRLIGSRDGALRQVRSSRESPAGNIPDRS
jgi:Acetyltransferase (GNAT) domain